MKNVTLLSLVTAVLLFTACGEETKEAAQDATSKVTEAVKADVTTAKDDAKAAAQKAAQAAKVEAAKVADAATKMKEEAAVKVAAAATAVTAAGSDAVDAVKKTVTDAVAPVADNAAGKAAYAKCAGCHGANGKTKALGKSAVIAGQDKATLIASLNGYKAGTRNVAGMGALMKTQVGSMDEATITAVAEYISSL